MLNKRIPNKIIGLFIGAGVILTLGAIILPVICCDDGTEAEFVVMRASLRSIRQLLENYALDHDGVYAQPDEFAEIFVFYGYDWPEPVLGDRQDDIWMCPIPWEDRRIPDDFTQQQLGQIPMLHNKIELNQNGTLVVFWDESVRLLSNEEFAEFVNVKDSICLGCQFLMLDFLNEQQP